MEWLGAVWLILTVLAAWRLGSSWRSDRAASERIGLVGLGLMAIMGWITFLVAWLVPGGAGHFWLPTWCVALAGLLIWKARPQGPKAQFEWQNPHKTCALLVGLLMIFPGVKALAPSDTTDWDTLAYHFAVPKIWLEQGSAVYIPTIHHSNFPFLVDALFMVGLTGAEWVAKMVTVALFGFGCLWLFGVSRRWFGPEPASVATVSFAATPLVLWSAGTGYIDLPHGLFASIALIAVAELVAGRGERREHWVIAGLALGAAMASKFTGLQMALALLVVLGCAVVSRRLVSRDRRHFAVALSLALLVASPWYVRNVINTGNPVYPFFYGVLGGRDWDKFRSEIYTDEQQTFGVGRTESGRDLAALPHALLGLAYQPGRYINPNQTTGGGFPMGSIGPLLLLGFLAAVSQCRRRPHRLAVVIASAVLIGMWFLLSQQVRYFAALLPAWAWLVASFVPQVTRYRVLLYGLIGTQLLYTFGLLKMAQLDMNLLAVTGRLDRQQYQEQVVPFAGVAREINALGQGTKVALFDEVFGYFLDVPYVWGNPGHSKRLGFEEMQSGADFVQQLSKEGITHVYVALRLPGSPPRVELAGALLAGQIPPQSWVDQMDADLRTRWQKHLVEAHQEGLLQVVPLSEENAQRGVLLRVVQN